jgi:hypothetical protein
MSFIEMTGGALRQVLQEEELPPGGLEAAGVDDSSIIRINPQGDIEIRRPDGWEVIGGLLGGFELRIREATGLNWA